MSQSDVYDFLKKRKNKWSSINQITKGVEGDRRTVTTAISKLLRWREIEVKETHRMDRNNKFIRVYRIPDF